MFKGREITRLMLIAALCCVLMVAAVTAYLVVSSRQHLKSQTEKMEQALADSIGKKLDVSFDNITTFLKKNPSIPFTSDAYNILLDLKRVLNFFVGCAWSMFDCDYAVILDENGNIYAGLARDGMDVNDFPIDVAEGMDASVDATAYKIVDSVAGRQGSFIIIARDMTVPTLAGTMREAMVINATDQVAALSQVYDEDKGDMVTRQVLVSLGIFLVLLALSILIIYFAIRRRLSGPIESINDSARSILSGKEAGSVEPDEKSIFYNLQLLLKSGSVIFRKSGQMEEGPAAPARGKGGSEVRKVLFFWIVLFFAISAISVAVLVFSSISLMNGKTNALKQDVVRQTADYYRLALDKVTETTMKSVGNVQVGQELWNPDPNASIDRLGTLERMRILLKNSYNADYAAYITDGQVKYSTEGSAELPGLPKEYAEGYTIMHDVESPGDTYIGLCKKTDYPIIGPEDQYIYTIVNITTQADAITNLYQDSRSQLLWSQLIIALILLVLSALLAAFGIGWAVLKYVAAPVRRLDELSSQVMDGSLKEDVVVDEDSSFSGIQRLLKQGQELLRKMNG